MTRTTTRWFHPLVAIGIVCCACCPLIEFLFDSTDSIFLTGHDMETTIGVLLVLLGVSIFALRVTLSFVPELIARVNAFALSRSIAETSGIVVLSLTASPPALALRI